MNLSSLPLIALALTASGAPFVLQSSSTSAPAPAQTPAARLTPPPANTVGVDGVSGNRRAVAGSVGTTSEVSAAFPCVARLADQAGGCLEASSDATLGMLYPLSLDLFVEQATGSVGLGTLSPDRRLSVVNDLANEGLATFDNPNAAGFSGIYFEENGEGRGWAGHVNDASSFGAPGTMQIGSQFDDLVFSVDDTQFFVERMRITTDGDVGIGVADPGGKLHVDGLIRSGSEAGTSQSPEVQGGAGPAYMGIVTRRVVSTNNAVGQVIARGPTLRLERDGTPGGLRIVWGSTVEAILSVHGYAVTQAGALLPIREWGFNQFGGGSLQITDNADTVVSLHLSFGNYHNSGHTTDVVINRSSLSSSWIGIVHSTYDQ